MKVMVPYQESPEKTNEAANYSCIISSSFGL